MPNHGHVVLADPSPILLYQIASRDTRILVDVPGSKYPSNANGELTAYLRSHVAPQLPAKGNVRSAFLHALDTQRVRVMPNPYLPPSTQGHVPGLILLGDAHNMRHPLTGGGMSVALNDVVILQRLLNCTAFPSFDGRDAQLRPRPAQVGVGAQTACRDTRILVDVTGSKYPSNANGELTAYLRSHVAPQLPAKGNVRSAFLHALDTQRVRVMPNPYLPPSTQGHVPGLILLGDAHNMRHPLTGGGMSVALNDVVILQRLLNCTAFPSFDGRDAQLRRVLRKWAWERKRLGAVVNILANALYALFFGGRRPAHAPVAPRVLRVLRLGGECTNAPVRLLACLAPSPMLLVRHFFAVAVHGAWGMIRREPVYWLPRTVVHMVRTMWTACRVILPLCWYEWRGAPKVAVGSGH
ncbi:hypothetical protein AMAG_20119 [Allomyces macrogynus ATCC 38327]|uniref:Squalene monooxygenase n=1 Tax=Allomyces macrogynus (strain ATCC 38327) TaxID=578462 RepID=A0A0L0T7F0_ALLM3|nr:hypothetical protein AMAG_20119 [Allomyces macrogynus ATCC 38327]|eukprot:KNE70464.1 hypothetical protein AMAG_20119 [Allomyces macrogynus ATCC 38327]